VGGTGAITCTAASAPAGSSGTIQLVVTVAAGTASGTIITDTVTVNSSNQAFGANSATITDVVATAGQADLALSTAATPAIVFPGNNITYTQTVTNNGPASAAGVTFTETVPANTTFVSVSAPAGWTCNNSVTCTDASLAAGTSADIIVVVNVAATVSVATITAASSVSATTTDPNPRHRGMRPRGDEQRQPQSRACRRQYHLHASDNQFRSQQLQHWDL
jgi:uncharacterized repeat protein (TIGR01451 family)